MIDVLNGKYQIVREIARSNDIVYEARDTALGRRIALKELNLSTVQGQAKRERIERFSREARAAGRLTHPNIVSVYESGAENDRYFIAMEFLEGQNLRDKIQMQGILPQADALNIAYQMLDALGYAHANKVIHRDIKPDNVQILPGGHVKLTDFGIARLTEEPALTGDGQVFGTPSYMSPEQIEGKGIDNRSDLFSTAIVLYEMLSGRKPFTGDSVITITYSIMNAEPSPMNGVPFAIENVIRRAMAKNPNQRFASAEQMKAELKNAEQTPVGAAPNRQPTNMGQSQTSYGLSPASYNPAAPPYNPAPMPGYAPPTNYAPPPQNGSYPPPPTNYAPPAAQQPWQWNGQPQSAPQPSPLPPGLPQNLNPYMANYRPPRDPITLSPGAKTLLYSLLAALVIGGGLAFGVVSFLRGYDQYRVEAGSQRITALMNEGSAAYNAQDFAGAATFYRQAWELKPSDAQRSVIMKNLAYSYIHLAQSEKSAENWNRAKVWYDKAIEVGDSESSDLARAERADVLQRLGKTAEAEKDRSQISANEVKPAPTRAVNAPPRPDASVSRDEADAPFRHEAQKLIEEGDALFNKNDVEGARRKWIDAAGKAPGSTPEHAAALERLDRTSQTPADSSSSDSSGQ